MSADELQVGKAEFIPYRDALEQLKAENARMRERTARVDAGNDELVKGLQGAMTALQGQNRELRSRIAILEKRIAELERELRGSC